jgi:hypothetical protein
MRVACPDPDRLPVPVVTPVVPGAPYRRLNVLTSIELAPDVKVMLAGDVTVLKVPDGAPEIKTEPTPQLALAVQLPPPTNKAPPVTTRLPPIVGEAVVGWVAAKLAGRTRRTVPAVAVLAIRPNRISLGSDKLIGGTMITAAGTSLISACATPGTRKVPSITAVQQGKKVGAGFNFSCLMVPTKGLNSIIPYPDLVNQR